MDMKLVVVGGLLAACGGKSGPHSAPPEPSNVARSTPGNATPAEGPRDVSAAWRAAVTSKDVTAIENMLAVPFTLYFDDNWTGKRPAECGSVRVVRTIKTAGERRQIATCIAATVIVSTPSEAGIWEASKLIPELPVPVQATVRALSADHVFVRGPMVVAGDFDFTLAIPRHGEPRADLLVLWTING